MMTIQKLNEMNQPEFIDVLKEIFEHSPWIPEKAWIYRPFSSVKDLHEKMIQVVADASYPEKLALIQAHPSLGTRLEMSSSSVKEQSGAGLSELSPEEYENFSLLNTQYTETFQFPFIMAVKGRTKDEIHSAMERRVHHEPAVEFETALSEIYKIAGFRLKELAESSESPLQ